MAMPIKLYRMPDILGLTGLSRSSIDRLVKIGQFPKPIKLGERAKAWDAETIAEWLELKKKGAA